MNRSTLGDISRSESIVSDYSPLSQACIKALTDRMDDKRKIAAIEIEKMTVEFSMSNNLTMINRLIIVLGRKFCLSHQQNTRKGGLLGLAAVMVGFKNGSTTEPPSEMVEEVVRPILTCLLDSDARVRHYACEALFNVTKVARSNILDQFESIFDSLTRMVADSDIHVRAGAESIDRLLKDIVVESKELKLDSFVHKLEDYIYTKNAYTRMFLLSWIRLLDSKLDIINTLPHLLDGIFNCLHDSTEEIRSSILSLLTEFLKKTDIQKFIKVLYKTFQANIVIFEQRGTFIILNLCNMVKPESVYWSFAEILKEERSDLKFAHNLVQKLNQILFTTEPLAPLRSQLSSEDDTELVPLFHNLYMAWCHSPTAAITLCLLTNKHRHANEIVIALAKAPITVELLIEIDWIVQLIESPVFAKMRLRLLDLNNSQYLIQALYGLLMILPQSDAYKRLSNRLDQVGKFISTHSHLKASTSTQSSGSRQGMTSSTSTGAVKDLKKINSLESLMKHYHFIQSLKSQQKSGLSSEIDNTQ